MLDDLSNLSCKNSHQSYRTNFTASLKIIIYKWIKKTNFSSNTLVIAKTLFRTCKHQQVSASLNCFSAFFWRLNVFPSSFLVLVSLSECHEHVHADSQALALQLLRECERWEGRECRGATAGLPCSCTGERLSYPAASPLQNVPHTRHVCAMSPNRAMERRETGPWACREKTWLVSILLRILWAGIMGCPVVRR